MGMHLAIDVPDVPVFTAAALDPAVVLFVTLQEKNE
jgi:hypothetical protein